MSRKKPIAVTKCLRYALDAARETLGEAYEITVEHGGRHAVHLHVTKDGGLWRIPVSVGGNRCEKLPAQTVARRCREIVSGKWGCQPA